jgi:methyl-accepting chemotaxis protein
MNQKDRVVRRKLTNLLLKPLLQTKIGLYCIMLSVLLAAVIFWIVYHNFADLVLSILELTDAPQEVREIINSYWYSIQFWVYTVLLVYVLLTILISVWYTHRFVGPGVAFHRHLKALAEGDYSYRTVLRRGDAFPEIAEALNQASEALEDQRHRGADAEVPPEQAAEHTEGKQTPSNL